MTRREQILAYWFGPEVDDVEIIDKRASFWFPSAETSPAIDAYLRGEFGDEFERACRGELAHWTAEPRGRLALILLLDQFPRNLFRDQAAAFAHDPAALAVAEEGLARGDDRALRAIERVFFYMPFMHSETLEVQRRSVALYSELLDEAPPAARSGFELVLAQAREHFVVIERFGRYPHRNASLGRSSTREELRFLETEPQPGRPAE